MTWGGWSSTFPEVSNVYYAQWPFAPNGFTNLKPCYVYTAFMLKDPSGGAHQLNLSHLDPTYQGVCLGMNPPLVEADTANDEYYQAALSFTGPGFPIVSGSDGTTYAFSGVGPTLLGTTYSLPTQIEDRNGNVTFVKSSFGGKTTNALEVTDTLGRTETTISAFGQNAVTSTVNSAGLTYQLNWGAITPTGLSVVNSPYNSSSNCTAIPNVASAVDPGNTSSVNVVKSISLPNGQQYSFTYDGATGFVKRITYPSGGFISYDWGVNFRSSSIGYNDGYGNQGACAYTYDTPAIAHR